jgi:hypothetical protein
MIQTVALILSLIGNVVLLYLLKKRPVNHVKVYQIAPNIFAHKLRTRKVRKDS